MKIWDSVYICNGMVKGQDLACLFTLNEISSLVFADGINVLLPFRIHEIVKTSGAPPLANHTTFSVIHC